jgi:hypothetical protein
VKLEAKARLLSSQETDKTLEALGFKSQDIWGETHRDSGKIHVKMKINEQHALDILEKSSVLKAVPDGQHHEFTWKKNPKKSLIVMGQGSTCIIVLSGK